MQKEFQKKIVSNVYNDSYILLKIPETNGNILSVRVQTRKLGKTFARGSIARVYSTMATHENATVAY